jgi:hypothetical protein
LVCATVDETKAANVIKISFLAIELMHMIRKGQIMMEETDEMSFAEQFYALAR